MWYAASTGGFYDSAIHTVIPGDAVEITAEEHAALLAGQMQGKRIVAGEDGHPVLADPPAGPTVPSVVSMRQARLALLSAGLLSDVEAVVAAAGQAAQIEWEYATELQRANPLLAQIGGAVGLDSDGIDALFVAAAAL